MMPLAWICVLAALLRVPGVFWGFELGDSLRVTDYHADEIRFVGMAQESLTGVTNDQENYPKSFGFQLALVARVLDASPTIPQMYLFGRLLSVLYGVGTILLTFLATRLLSNSPVTPLVAALFLAVAGLAVTESHYATADAANTFWLYAALVISGYYLQREARHLLALLIACTGVAFAVKMSVVALIPLAVSLIVKRRRLLPWAAAVIGTLAGFWAANGGRYTANNLLLTIRNVLEDNVDAIAEHDRLMNIPVYAAEIAAGVGLPVVLLAMCGAYHLARRLTANRLTLNSTAWLVATTLFMHAATMCLLDVPFARHMLPVIPVVAVVGAVGFVAVFRRRPYQAWGLGVILAYQVAYVASIEYFYVRDTRVTAAEWIRGNVPPGEEIAVTPYALLPELEQQYRLTAFNEASRYLVMHEAYYYRYIRSELTPTSAFPRWEQVYHGTYEHFVAIQKLLKGEEDRPLIERHQVKALTPELILYKRFLGTYPLFIGDILIFGPPRSASRPALKSQRRSLGNQTAPRAVT